MVPQPFSAASRYLKATAKRLKVKLNLSSKPTPRPSLYNLHLSKSTSLHVLHDQPCPATIDARDELLTAVVSAMLDSARPIPITPSSVHSAEPSLIGNTAAVLNPSDKDSLDCHPPPGLALPTIRVTSSIPRQSFVNNNTLSIRTSAASSTPADQSSNTAETITTVTSGGSQTQRPLSAVVLRHLPACPPGLTGLIQRNATSTNSECSIPSFITIGDKRYIIHSELGSGAMGTVMHASNARCQDVAIKVLRKTHYLLDDIEICENDNSGAMVSDIANEIRIMNLIDKTGCSFLGRTMHIFQDASFVYYVMPLYHQSLHSRLTQLAADNKVLCLHDIRLYAAEVILAIQALHSMGVYHLDIKPDNIMINSEGHIRLIDFSISEVSAGILSGPRGTRGYIAPECEEREWFSASAADLYSYGVVLHQLLSCPYSVMDREGHVTQDFDSWKHKVPYAKDLCSKLLDVDPDNRYAVGLIQKHLFFDKIIWSDVRASKVLPRYKPLHPAVVRTTIAQSEQAPLAPTEPVTARRG